MRRVFQGRAGVVLAFVLGVVIASAATAGAAGLITGNQIKNGSISAKDLSKPLRKKLNKPRLPGPRGLQGPQGPPGVAGPAGPLTTTLPAGQTLRGAFNLDSVAAGASASNGQAVSFGFSLRSAPTVVVRPVGASPTAQCPGTLGNPEAASGVVCFYLSSRSNLEPTPNFPDGLRVLSLGAGGQANVFGAELFVFSAAGGRFFADGTWAVTGN